MFRNAYMNAHLDETSKMFNEKTDMLVRYAPPRKNYHSAASGYIHNICGAANFALEVFQCEREEYYPMARRILKKVCQLQDTRPGSRTFGLWSYEMEESLDDMKAPDYNWANFVGKNLIEACACHADKLDAELVDMLKTAVRNAVQCTIKRNVGLDYTNIIVMSTYTLISAAELLGDEELLAYGKTRLKNFYEYTKFNGAFTEYNSPNYGRVVLCDVARMLKLFKDEECRQIAEYINETVWTMLATHYNKHLDQLAPPQMRAYQDVDRGVLALVIYNGTNGKYGKCPDNYEDYKKLASMEELCCMPKCPEKCLPLFEADERVIACTFSKKNDLRQLGEDLTIVREFDCPDLFAYSYQTPAYSMGAFRLCDTWNQRRNVMVEWDKDTPKSFRLRGIHNDYDYCSMRAFVEMDKNNMLGQVGTVTDRGSYHYILDKDKSGVYDVEELAFRFELGGNCENVTIEADGKDFYIRDCGLTIKLHVETWVFDGKEAPVYVSEDGKMVILEGYRGESKQIDTTALADTYGVFTLSVIDETKGEKAEALTWNTTADGKVESAWGELKVSSYRAPVPYRVALGIDKA